MGREKRKERRGGELETIGEKGRKEEWRRGSERGEGLKRRIWARRKDILI